MRNVRRLRTACASMLYVKEYGNSNRRKSRNATLSEICAWVDVAPNRAARRDRKEVRYIETYRTRLEDIAQALGISVEPS